MGMPTSYKRSRRSPSPEGGFESPDMAQYRDWAPLANSTAKTATPSALRFQDTLLAPARSTTATSPPSAQGKSPMEQLTEPLLLKILQMSQPTAWDLCRMSCVGRAWRTACAHSSFWTRLRIGSGSLRPGVEQLAPRCAELAELFVDDPRCELHILHPILIACAHSLRRVVIDCDRDASPRNEASISSVLWLVSLYCKDVESIELQSQGREATIGCLEGRTMWCLTSAFRNVRYFACLAKGSLTKQCIYLMAIAWRDLECVRINMEGLQTEDLLALRKCTSLRALELVGGSLEEPVRQDGVAPLRRVPAGQGSVFPVSHEPPDEGELDHCSRDCSVAGQQPVELLRGTGASPAEKAYTRQPGGLAAALSSTFHPSLELLILNRVQCEAATVANLALACPSLKRILVSGALCDSCLLREGPCLSHVAECVRKRVDLIQLTLSQVRVSLHQ